MEGLTHEKPIHLPGDCTDFERLLSIFYPTCVVFVTLYPCILTGGDRSFLDYDAKTVEEWGSILRLAIQYEFSSIRNLAAAKIFPIATAVDKIVYGRLHSGLEGWLRDAYVELCTREQALSKEEGRKLGVDDVVSIAEIRQEIRPGSIARPHYTIVGRVNAAFQLPVYLEEVSNIGTLLKI